MITVNCSNCKKQFLCYPSQIKRGYAKNCSLVCSGASRTAETLRGRQALKQPKGYRLIPLAGGKIAKVSIEDFEELSGMNWQVAGNYVQRRGHAWMHRLVMKKMNKGEYAPLEVDHINRDPLDNRRNNLRLVTRAQNTQNRRRRRERSKFIGVCKGKRAFIAQIGAEGVRIHIGSFSSASDAAYMRDQFAMELHGEHAVLNFEY